jgi:hypothetical protein
VPPAPFLTIALSTTLAVTSICWAAVAPVLHGALFVHEALEGVEVGSVVAKPLLDVNRRVARYELVC